MDKDRESIEKRLTDGGFVNKSHVAIFVDEYASQVVQAALPWVELRRFEVLADISLQEK